MTKKKTSQAEAAKTDTPKGTDIEQDLSFQRKMWIAQRIGWALFSLVMLAGLAGLFGSGPLAAAKASGDAGLTVEYERFARRDTLTSIRIDPAGAPLSPEGMLDLAISQRFLENFTIERIIPEPDSESLSADKVIYHFKVGENHSSPIVLYVNPQRAGSWTGEIGLADSSPITITQLIYP